MKMKKLATGFLAAAMMLSVSNAVFASDTISYTDCGSVTITKVYEAEKMTLCKTLEPQQFRKYQPYLSKGMNFSINKV